MEVLVITRKYQPTATIKRVINLQSEDVIDLDNVIVAPSAKRATVMNIIINNPDDYQELVYGDNVRLFFDYDRKEPYSEELTNQLIIALNNTIQECVRLFNYQFFRSGHQLVNDSVSKYMEYVVIRNTNNRKHSLHIIYPRIVMDYQAMKKFVLLLKSIEASKDILSDIDTQVYRKHPTLRPPYSLKNSDVKEQLLILSNSTKSGDYFITPDDNHCLLRSALDTSSVSIVHYLESIFGLNNVVNTEDIRGFVSNPRTNSLTIELATKLCNLCGESHNRPFFIKKLKTNNGHQYNIYKNGTCLGLSNIKPYKQEMSHSASTSSLNSLNSSGDVLFQIATDILMCGDVRKTPDGLYAWNKQSWKKITHKDLGSSIIRYKDGSEYLSQDVKSQIENAVARKMIVDNIYDILTEYHFQEPPDNYVMCKNGLLDINTLELVTNAKDYNITNSLNASYIRAGESELEDKLYLELVKELRKIVAPICREATDGAKRSEDWSRFKQAMGSLLLGRSTTEVFHFYGKSDGGKSLIVDMLLIALGSYGYKGRLDILKTNKSAATDEALADYRGKLVTVISELPADFMIDETKLKNITETMVTADKKYISQSTFRNRARTIIDSNYLVDVNSVDNSVRKRIQSFHFRSHFSIDNKVDDYLAREFIRNDELGRRTQSGEFSNALLRFMIMCCKEAFRGAIVPDDRSTLIHQARSFEIKTLLDNRIIDKPSMIAVIPNLVSSHYMILDKYCPILKELLLQSPNRQRVNSQIALAINYLPEIRHMVTPIIEQFEESVYTKKVSF